MSDTAWVSVRNMLWLSFPQSSHSRPLNRWLTDLGGNPMWKHPKMETSWKGNVPKWKALTISMALGVWALPHYSEVVVPIWQSIIQTRKWGLAWCQIDIPSASRHQKMCIYWITAHHLSHERKICAKNMSLQCITVLYHSIISTAEWATTISMGT